MVLYIITSKETSEHDSDSYACRTRADDCYFFISILSAGILNLVEIVNSLRSFSPTRH